MSNAVMPLHAEEDGIYTPRRDRSRYPSNYSSVDSTASATAARISKKGQGASTSDRASAAQSGSRRRVSSTADSGDVVLTDSLKRSSLRNSGTGANGMSGPFKASTPPSVPSAAAAATKVPPHASSAPRAHAPAAAPPPPPPPAPVRPVAQIAAVARSPATSQPSPLVYKKPNNPREALGKADERAAAAAAAATPSTIVKRPVATASPQPSVSGAPQRSVSPQRPAQPPLLPFGLHSPTNSNRSSTNSTDFISTSGVGRPVRSNTSTPANSTQNKPQMVAAVQSFNERLMNARAGGSRPTSALSSSTNASRSPTPRVTPTTTTTAKPATTTAPLARPPTIPAPPRPSGISPTLTNSTNTSSSHSTGSGIRSVTAAVPRPPSGTPAASSASPHAQSQSRATQPTAAPPAKAPSTAAAPKTAPALPSVGKTPSALPRSSSEMTTSTMGSGAAASMSQQRRVTVPMVHPRVVPTAHTTGPSAQNGRMMTHPYPTSPSVRATPTPTPTTTTTTTTNNSNANKAPMSNGVRSASTALTTPAVTLNKNNTSNNTGTSSSTNSATTARTTPPGATTTRPTPPSSATPATTTPARPAAAVATKTPVTSPPPAPQRRVPLSSAPTPTAPTAPTPVVAAKTAPAPTPTPTPVRSPPTTNAYTPSTTARNGSAPQTRPPVTTTPTPTTAPRLSPTTATAPVRVAPVTTTTTNGTSNSTSHNTAAVVRPPQLNLNGGTTARTNGTTPSADEDVMTASVATKRNTAIKPISPPRPGGPDSVGKSTEPASPARTSPAANLTVTAPARGARQRGTALSPSNGALGASPGAPKPGPSLLRTQRSLEELTDATNSSLELSLNGAPGLNAGALARAPSTTVSPRASGGATGPAPFNGRQAAADALLDSPTSAVGLPSFGASAGGARDDDNDNDDDDDAGYHSDGPKTPRAARRDSRRTHGAGGGQRKRAASADKKHKKKTTAVSSAEELATLAQYLEQEELNLSMSTFNSVQILAQSHNLRVLNLKGSTLSSEGLRGLGNVPTLQSLCVSHMRKLRSLVPLITTAANGRCALQEIDAQCTPLDDAGILGLEKLPRLVKLDLSMTSVTDVSTLSASRSLRELYVSVTRVNNAGIAGLEKIPTLKVLQISRSKVTSVVNIARSHSIDTLILYSCKVDDAGVQGVQHMPRLTTLDVSTTKITNLSILEVSTSLKSLKAQWLALKNCYDIIQQRRQQMDRLALESSGVLRSEQEAGYSGLAKIPTLESLDLSFNTIRSVSSLCESKSLKRLILRRTRVDNKGIAQIDKLSRTLEELVVTNITDTAEESEEELSSQGSGGTMTGVSAGMLSSVLNLAGLAHLVSLDLSFTDVFDLRMLQILQHLKELSIVETLVTVDGLRGIELIPTLEVLDVSQTSVMSLQFLVSGAKSLKKIIARSNRNVRGFRLGHLENLPRLEHLDMSDTVVEDVRLMWTAAWGLKELVWRWKERREATGLVVPLECWVTSERLTGLNKLPNLTMIDLSNSSVHNLLFLEGSRALQRVVLDGSRLLRDDCIASIAKCKRIDTVDLSNVPHLTNVLGLISCPNLKELRLTNTGVTGKGIEGVTQMPQMKSLDIANTPAEEEMIQAMGEKASTASRVNGVNMNNSFSYTRPQSRMMEESSLADVSMMDTSATPAQFRVPRRRRVSFVGGDAPVQK